MPATGGVVGGVPGGIPGGQLGGVIGGIVSATSNAILGHHLSRWPVFNIADAAVTCGVVLLLFFHRGSSKNDLQPVPLSADASAITPDSREPDSRQIPTHE